MTMVSVGAEFFMKRPVGMQEGGVALLNDSSFDVVYYINGGTKADADVWRRGDLRYGVFKKDHVPFFLLAFPEAGWLADFSFNFLAERKNRTTFDNFLVNKGNAITFYLVESRTNVVLSLRMVGIKSSVMDEIKQACREQLGAYASRDAVNQRISEIMGAHSTMDMMRQAKMSKSTDTEKDSEAGRSGDE